MTIRRNYQQQAFTNMKIDIRKYFPGIDHAVLKEKLSPFPDEEVKMLLYRIIDSYAADTGKGLPMGNQSSQWFALYYLDRLDRLIKERLRIKGYVRYMDDGVFLGWHFYLTDTGKVIRRLRTSNKKRFKRRLKAFQKQYAQGTKTLSEITQSLNSYQGHLKHGHTWKLRKQVYQKFILSRHRE